MKNLFRIALVALGLSALQFGGAAANDMPPPQSDTWSLQSQFLACKGNSYALCYYSGPEIATPSRHGATPPVMPCTVDANSDGKLADCTCYAVTDVADEADGNPLGIMFQYNYVLLTSILQPDVYDNTLSTCGPTGKNCLNLKNLSDCADNGFQGDSCQQADVCSMLGDISAGVGQTLYKNMPDMKLISTFSFQNISQHSFGSTACEADSYAGCMTAPCKEGADGLTTCQCPVYEGPYQVGQQEKRLKDLGLGCEISPNVWSAANHVKPSAQ
ncbi:hypothetical protein [Roseibium sp. M-1]